MKAIFSILLIMATSAVYASDGDPDGVSATTECSIEQLKTCEDIERQIAASSAEELECLKSKIPMLTCTPSAASSAADALNQIINQEDTEENKGLKIKARELLELLTPAS